MPANVGPASGRSAYQSAKRRRTSDRGGSFPSSATNMKIATDISSSLSGPNRTVSVGSGLWGLAAELSKWLIASIVVPAGTRTGSSGA